MSYNIQPLPLSDALFPLQLCAYSFTYSFNLEGAVLRPAILIYLVEAEATQGRK